MWSNNASHFQIKKKHEIDTNYTFFFVTLRYYKSKRHSSFDVSEGIDLEDRLPKQPISIMYTN